MESMAFGFSEINSETANKAVRHFKREALEDYDRLLGDDEAFGSYASKNGEAEAASAEIKETKSEGKPDFSRKALEDYDRLLGDDKLPVKLPVPDDRLAKTEIKADQLSETETDTGEAADKPSGADPEAGESAEHAEEPDCNETREPNSQYEFNGHTYETDDKGRTFRRDGELLPDTEYTINGNTYRTDEHGNKVEVEAAPKYTKDNSRDIQQQKEAGGEDREADDDGGHLIARILGGSEGDENIVPMRRTINRGDYKKMENEIAEALREGKDVRVHIDLEYDGDSKRPSKITVRYEIDGKTTEAEFDNVEGSTELLDSLADKLEEEDYIDLQERIADMNDDGGEAAVTSIKTERDETGKPAKVTVGILNEASGEKTYIEYEPRRQGS